MTFERTTDVKLITGLLSNPQIWDAITDDGSPAREDLVITPEQANAMWAVVAYDGDELLGMFMFEVRNHVEWTVHTCLLPSAWGPRALTAARGVIQWIWGNTVCRRITTHVPEYNRLALRFAKEAGLIEYGRNPRSWSHGGLLHDQIELGISKE